MAHVPMNRVRALVICHAPQTYAPSRVREAASYLLQSSVFSTSPVEWGE
jgi:hypothetical protein